MTPVAGAARRLATVAAFGLASVINPGYFGGCASDEHAKPNFGEREMLELVDEANAASPFEIDAPGEDYRLELSLSQEAGADSDDVASLLISRAYACGTRSFKQSASACVTTSRVPLRARYSLFRVADNGEETELVRDRELTGELEVFGNKLGNGKIDLRDASQETMIELLSPDGAQIELHRFVSRVDGVSVIL